MNIEQAKATYTAGMDNLGRAGVQMRTLAILRRNPSLATLNADEAKAAYDAAFAQAVADEMSDKPLP